MRRRAAAAVLPAALLAAAAGVCCAGCRSRSLQTIEIELGGQVFRVEVARTPEDKKAGLMHRQKLGRRRGMLFVYEVDSPMSFWMANTYIPLSIAFVDRQGTILQIEDMEPLDLTTVKSRIAARYALEVNQGVFEELGVRAGDRILFPEGFR